ncbi:MAG TPA: enoyl-CoA hydratase/isomerase family protein [Burkholderiaceae bacterium]|nr:enoyl-CoA hydratase/isomerase family protein [Burkholderiaceae bacterium]
MTGQIHVASEGHLAWVTLSHAGKFNAMSRAMWRALRELFEDIQRGADGRNPDVRCVVIRGEAGHFCAGGDIAEYPAFRFDVQSLRAFHEEEVWGGLQAMLDCDVPIVAQIEGNCMGAGLEIASCADIRLAAASARFGAPIARLGFPMAPREAALVAQQAGSLTARQMLLEAAVFSAAEMRERGFLSAVPADEDLPAEALACARRIAALAPQAARMNKQTLREIQPATYSLLLERDPYAYADGAEHREGITAFLEKRKPAF